MDNNIIGITMKAGFVINVIIIFFRCLLFWIQIPDILFSFAPKICQKYLLTPVQCLDKLKACQCLLFFDQFVRVQTHRDYLFCLRPSYNFAGEHLNIKFIPDVIENRKTRKHARHYGRGMGEIMNLFYSL